MEEEEIGHKGFDLRLMARLMNFLRPYTRWVVLTFVLIIVAAVVRQAGPYLTKIAVDDYIVPGDADGLTYLVMVYIGLLVAQFGVGYCQSWTTNMIGQWAMHDVRLKIFMHLQRLPMRYFDRTPVGRLMARNTNDVDALNELFTDGIVSMISDIFTIITILAYIFYMDVTLGALICLALPVAFVATMWLQNKTFFAYRVARTLFARFSSSLQETVSGMEVVQLFGCEDRCMKRFEDPNKEYLDARLKSSYYHAIYFPIMELGGVLLSALVLWHGGVQVLDGEIPWGVLVAMLQYVPRFFMPLRDIADRFTVLQVAMASSERIFELLDAKPESLGGTVKADHLKGEIAFQNVWFAYNEGEWVLRDVSFRVAPGQSLALVGATGAGKSTVINLVCRFYDIQRGAILVDGVDIREWDVEELRRRIGIVQQDVFLFAGDIEANISLGHPRISRQEVEQAARDVNADRFIDKLSDTYQHEVQERGSSLSVGQRQLISFARTLASGPDILILDEATASVDTETEMWIQDAVAKLMRSRTSIAIAHRLSTIRNADKILVMHHGQIREEGDHDTLIKQNGIYARLYQLQYEGTG